MKTDYNTIEMKKVFSALLAVVVAASAISCGTKNSQKMTNESEKFIFEASTQWQDAGGGAERQILGYNDNIMMVKVSFDAGEVGAVHAHPHTQVTYVAEGKFEFTIGGETKIVSKGDALYMEPDVEHGCTCLETGILIDCFNPMRDTFIGK